MVEQGKGGASDGGNLADLDKVEHEQTERKSPLMVSRYGWLAGMAG